jgi:hypothetical protein
LRLLEWRVWSQEISEDLAAFRGVNTVWAPNEGVALLRGRRRAAADWGLNEGDVHAWRAEPTGAEAPDPIAVWPTPGDLERWRRRRA